MTENVNTYSKPAVRDAWADTAQSGPTADLQDPDAASAFTPGNPIVPSVSKGWQQNTTPPPRQFFNWILNWLSNGIRYFSQRGIVDWDAAELYQVGAVVQFQTFIYQSATNNNANNRPDLNPTLWTALSGYALLASPNFIGNPQVPNITIANGAPVAPALQTQAINAISVINALVPYLTAAGAANIYATISSLSAYAKLSGAAFTGPSTIPTPAATINNTQIVNAAWVNEQLGSASLAANGYEITANGRYEQWGIAQGVPGSPGATIPFPIGFPHACNNVVACPYQQNATVTVLSFNANTFQLINGVSGLCTWRATGF